MSSFSLGAGFIDLTARDANFQAVLGRVSASMFRLQRQFRDFTTAAGAILAVGAGAALFGGAVKSAEDFEYQMAKVSTVMSKTTVGILPDLAAGVRGLSVEFGRSTQDLTNALYEILSAGVPAANSLQVLRVAAGAAQAGFTDVGTAGDILATVLNSYQIGADKAAEVSDKLFEAVRNGRLHFEDFHATLGRVTPLAHAAGVSLDELLGAISTITNAGATPEQATTQVLNLLKAFIKPKKAAVKAANELGLAFDLEAIKTKGLAGALEQLQGLDPDTILKLFPDIRGAQGALALVGNLKQLREQITGIGNSSGATADALNKVLPTATVQFQRLGEFVKDTARSVGTILLPAVKSFIFSLQDIAIATRIWIDNNNSAILTSANLAVSLAKVTAALYLTETALKAVGVAMKFVAANPLIVLGVGLFVLADQLIKTADAGNFFIADFKKAMNELVSSLTGGAVTSIDFGNILSNAFETAKFAFETLATSGALWLTKLQYGAQAAWDVMKYIFADVLPVVFKNVTEVIGNAFYNAFKYSQTILLNFKDNVVNIWNEIVAFLDSRGKHMPNIQFKGLTDGYKKAAAVIQELPAFQLNTPERQRINQQIAMLEKELEDRQNDALKRREAKDNAENAKKRKQIEDLKKAREAADEEARKKNEERNQQQQQTDEPPDVPEAPVAAFKASFVGVQDLFKQIQQSAAAPEETDAAAATAKNTKATADATKQINAGINKLVGAVPFISVTV